MEIIDLNLKNKQTQVTFEAIGWKSLLQKRGGSSKLLIIKSVVLGLGLERGMPVYSYVGMDAQERPVLISYLDGKPKSIKANLKKEGGEVKSKKG